MNKKNLAKHVAERANITEKAATAAIDAVFATIAENLEEGVSVSGFGNFGLKTRNARQGINPATKEKIDIPASSVPYFKAAKALKDVCKEQKAEN